MAYTAPWEPIPKMGSPATPRVATSRAKPVRSGRPI